MVDFPYDANDENDDEYDEGLGSSLSSVGFSDLKLNNVGLANAFPSFDFAVPAHVDVARPLLQPPQPQQPPQQDLVPPFFASHLLPEPHQRPSVNDNAKHEFHSAHFDGQEALVAERVASEGDSAWTNPTTRPHTTSIPPHTSSPNKKKGGAPETISERTHDANGKKIKRPMNAYMLWLKAARKACSKTPLGKSGLTHEAEKCASMGARWKQLHETEKAPWFAKAAEAKKQHKKDYPLWKYTPSSPKAGKKVRKRALALKTAHPQKRICKRSSQTKIAGLDVPQFVVEVDCQNDSDSSSSSTSLLEPLTPFFMDNQEEPRQAFDMCSAEAVPSVDMAAISSMLLSDDNCFAAKDFDDFLSIFE